MSIAIAFVSFLMWLALAAAMREINLAGCRCVSSGYPQAELLGTSASRFCFLQRWKEVN
jgi:hypothetical protein